MPLFNGKDLTGWYTFSNGKKNEDPDRLIQVHDGMIHMYKDAPADSKQPFGYISTIEEFSDYHLRLEFKWGPKRFAPRQAAKRDAGLLYHTIGEDRVWPQSVECQIQETDTGDIFTVRTRVVAPVDPATTKGLASGFEGSVQPRHKSQAEGGIPFLQGSPSSVRRVIRSENYEVPGWNTCEVIIRGDTAVHIINGKTNNVVLKMEYPSGDQWLPLSKGRIVLQKEGAEVMYRNIEIKRLGKK